MMIMIKRRAGENIRNKVVAIFESCGVNIMLLKTREPTGRPKVLHTVDLKIVNIQKKATTRLVVGPKENSC